MLASIPGIKTKTYIHMYLRSGFFCGLIFQTQDGSGVDVYFSHNQTAMSSDFNTTDIVQAWMDPAYNTTNFMEGFIIDNVTDVVENFTNLTPQQETPSSQVLKALFTEITTTETEVENSLTPTTMSINTVSTETPYSIVSTR